MPGISLRPASRAFWGGNAEGPLARPGSRGGGLTGGAEQGATQSVSKLLFNTSAVSRACRAENRAEWNGVGWFSWKEPKLPDRFRAARKLKPVLVQPPALMCRVRVHRGLRLQPCSLLSCEDFKVGGGSCERRVKLCTLR